MRERSQFTRKNLDAKLFKNNRTYVFSTMSSSRWSLIESQLAKLAAGERDVLQELNKVRVINLIPNLAILIRL